VLLAVVLVALDFLTLVVVMVEVLVETAVHFALGLLLLCVRSCRGGRGVRGVGDFVLELPGLAYLMLPPCLLFRLLLYMRAWGVVLVNEGARELS